MSSVVFNVRRFQSAMLSACLAAVFLSGCETIPYVTERTAVPVPVVVPDASPERLALNTRVYDSSVRWVSQRFYKRDFGGIDWPGEAAARREAAIGQPTEADFYRALNETLDLLGDGHTSALSPTRNRELEQQRLAPSLTFDFLMARIEQQLIVTYVLPGGTAEAAGIRLGWRAESVNGQPVGNGRNVDRQEDGQYEMGFTDAEEQSHTVVIGEAEIPFQVGISKMREDGILVLSFKYFGQATQDWFEVEMRKAIADPPKGIIVDLRDNRGGLISAVGRTLSPFFAERQPYAYIEYGYLPRFPERTRRWEDIYDGPVAVVVFEPSASGAEVFAATMQETGRGIVVGEKTRGSVIASRQIDLPDGGELSIGIRGFRSGQGRVLEGSGVTPDIPVTVTAADLRTGRDPMIDAAAERLLSGPAVSP
ncbi:S41 family peptidase [Brevundimonas sp.]